MSDTRHRQLSRIYARSIESDDDARAAIRRDPGILASALFEECAQSDDVTSIETARAYLGDRLEFLGDLVEADADAVREAFEARVAAWG
jgi:hypothetical protein